MVVSTKNGRGASDHKVVNIADRARETLRSPNWSRGRCEWPSIFIGKRIALDGTILDYPDTLKWFRQSVAQVAATIPALFAYLREARTRNICLIRGAPANLERKKTRRQNAHEVHRGKDRGDHGFLDEPTKLFFLDVDDIRMSWRDDPKAQSGKSWRSWASRGTRRRASGSSVRHTAWSATQKVTGTERSVTAC